MTNSAVTDNGITFDDDLLDEVGLGALPAKHRAKFLRYMYETLELRVGETLSNGMSDDQLAEFESIIDRDPARIMSWLELCVPDFLSDPLYAAMKERLEYTHSPTDIVCEYAATKWLEVSRPGYRDIVAAQFKALKAEVAAAAAEILAG